MSLWIIVGDASHAIVSCNTAEKEGKHQIWVERTNGKTLKIGESDKKEDVQVIKDAIDYAIDNGERTLDLN